MSHTPGPWTVDDDEIVAGEVHVVCFGHDYDDYGGFHGRWPRPKGHRARYADGQYEIMKAEADANARLIAAAPDLLAALEAAWPGLSGQSYERPISEVWEQARSAIAKAKGEA